MLNRRGFLCAVASVGVLWCQPSILIRDALVFDGTGHAPRRESVRIVGDRIHEIGRLKPLKAEEVIEAHGLALSPGFIDVHNHSSNVDREREAATQVSQGITTMLLGQDGSSAAELPIPQFLQMVRDAPVAVNIQLLVGHETVRALVMGKNYKRVARPEEVVRMAELVEQAMAEGAVGLSTGLEYEVGSYSDTVEVIALAKAAARHGGIYVSHIRDESDRAFDSLREAIRIGEEAQIPVQISHIKLGTTAVWGKSGEAVKLIEAARARGLDITADCYPYDAWSSTIKVLVPDKRYNDPASVRKALADVGGPANVTVTSCRAHRDYEGKNLEQLARSLGTTPVSLYSQIVKDGGASVVCKAMTDEDIRTFYRQPWVMVASDGGIAYRHPRGAGTFPRVLGEYVRERQWLTLPEAIRKMTSAPAARLKLKDRGVIRQGAFADLVLFDPARIQDRSTFQEPGLLATGVEKVFVNGDLVWDGERVTGRHPGRILGEVRPVSETH